MCHLCVCSYFDDISECDFCNALTCDRCGDIITKENKKEYFNIKKIFDAIDLHKEICIIKEFNYDCICKYCNIKMILRHKNKP